MQAVDIHLLAFDASAIAYASAYVLNLSRLAHNGLQTGVIHGTVNSVLSTLREHPNALGVILMDGHAAWRKAILPDYKGNRQDTPEKIEIRAQVRRQLPIALALLHELGIPLVRHPDAEADDLAGMLVRHAQRCRIPTRMISPDSDWWQGIGECVDWYSTRDRSRVDMAALRTMDTKKSPPDGWRSPREYIEAKIIAGDTGDMIDGIAGAGLPTAAKILRSAKNGLAGVMRGEFDASGVVAGRMRTPDGLALLRRNEMLIDWILAPMPDPDFLGISAYPASPEAARQRAVDHGLQAVLKHINPFAGNDSTRHALWNEVVRAFEHPSVTHAILEM